MILNILQSANWIDLAVLALMIRALVIGLKRGIADEILHLVGMLFAVFVVFHYTPVIAHFLTKVVNPGMAKGVAYFGLWIVVSLFTKLVRDGLRAIFKIEAHSFVNKLGGVLVAVARGFVVCSMMIWFLRMTGHEYPLKAILTSLSGPSVERVAPVIYKKTYSGFIVKYFPNEKINRDVLTEDEIERLNPPTVKK